MEAAPTPSSSQPLISPRPRLSLPPMQRAETTTAAAPAPPPPAPPPPPPSALEAEEDSNPQHMFDPLTNRPYALVTSPVGLVAFAFLLFLRLFVGLSFFSSLCLLGAIMVVLGPMLFPSSASDVSEDEVLDSIVLEMIQLGVWVWRTAHRKYLYPALNVLDVDKTICLVAFAVVIAHF